MVGDNANEDAKLANIDSVWWAILTILYILPYLIFIWRQQYRIPIYTSEA